MRDFRLRVDDGGTQEWPGVAKLLIQSHFVSFSIVYAGQGFTLILAFSPQGRRDLTAFAGTTGAEAGTRVGGATAGTESLGRGQAPVVYLGYARDRTG